MAVTAIDTVIAYMMLMAKLNRLLLFDILPGQIRRPCELRKSKTCDASQNNAPDHADPGDIVCTFIKKLCHP